MLSAWNASQLPSHLTEQLRLDKFTYQALKCFHTSITKFCHALLQGLYFSRRHSKTETATATKPITSAYGTMATTELFVISSVMLLSKTGCQIMGAHTLHSNTYTMAFWIVVTSKLCNFIHNNEVLISLH